MVIGGAFLTTAVLFSFASGIFHPYYVSLLAPFTAALVGAGAAQLIAGRIDVRIFGPLAIVAGVVGELIVLGDYSGQLTWLVPVLIVAGILASVALSYSRAERFAPPPWARHWPSCSSPRRSGPSTRSVTPRAAPSPKAAQARCSLVPGGFGERPAPAGSPRRGPAVSPLLRHPRRQGAGAAGLGRESPARASGFPGVRWGAAWPGRHPRRLRRTRRGRRLRRK